MFGVGGTEKVESRSRSAREAESPPWEDWRSSWPRAKRSSSS